MEASEEESHDDESASAMLGITILDIRNCCRGDGPTCCAGLIGSDERLGGVTKATEPLVRGGEMALIWKACAKAGWDDEPWRDGRLDSADAVVEGAERPSCIA